MTVWKIRKIEWAPNAWGNIRWKQRLCETVEPLLYETERGSVRHNRHTCCVHDFMCLILCAPFCILLIWFFLNNIFLGWLISCNIICFSTSRFQLPHRSRLLPCVSFPSTYPATAKTSLRPASTASTNMYPGILWTSVNMLSSYTFWIISNICDYLLLKCFFFTWILSHFFGELLNLCESPSYF